MRSHVSVLVGVFIRPAVCVLGQVSTTPGPLNSQVVTPNASVVTSEPLNEPTAAVTTETRVRRTEGTEVRDHDDWGKWGLAGLLELLGLAGLSGRRQERVVVNRAAPLDPDPVPPTRRS